MSAGPSNLIKAQILANLQALITAGTIASIKENDINESVFDLDFASFPAVVLGPSNMTANWEYEQANKRTYEFDLMVIQLQDNLATAGDIEDLRDAIALQFDNNVTLNGTAVFGVDAVTSPRINTSQRGKNYAIFYVTIRATTLVNLNYTF